MSKIVLATCGLLLGLACIIAGVMNRRLKEVERDFEMVIEIGHRIEGENCEAVCRERACRRAGCDNLQQQLDKLKAKCAGFCEGNCCRCPLPSPCCCLAKHVETKPPPVSKFCRFTMIQIDGVAKTAWFKWLDIDGVEHETRMSLSEFETWGTSQK